MIALTTVKAKAQRFETRDAAALAGADVVAANGIARVVNAEPLEGVVTPEFALEITGIKNVPGRGTIGMDVPHFLTLRGSDA